jgi:hypothetical protein
MTIPLNNLYDYIYGVFPEPVQMYLFYPFGSRNISNLITYLQLGPEHIPNTIATIYPSVVCNDQEPLNYQFYQNYSPEEIELYLKKFTDKKQQDSLLNLRFALSASLYDQIILLHSEKNSIDLDLYQSNGYIGAYYWCHAFITKDWYRFAEHDPRLLIDREAYRDFLIYCRDWSGSREYRAKFQELLFDNDLVKHSVTGFNQTNSQGKSIKIHNFKNSNFVPNNYDFIQAFNEVTVEASVSAEYSPEDLLSTRLSVILETVFDDSKIHLTEKTLRPIACGHPFILAAGPGSLEYLRSYGFKTFSPWINEDYDLETDSVNRLKKIIQSMKEFSSLSVLDKKQVIAQLKKISDYNKDWFFSKHFTEIITKELQSNVQQAIEIAKHTRSRYFRTRKKYHNTKQTKVEIRKVIANCLRKLKKVNPPVQ